MDTNILNSLREELREEFKDQFPNEEKKDCESDKINSLTVQNSKQVAPTTASNYVKNEEIKLTQEKDLLIELSNFCENIFKHTNDILDPYFTYKSPEIENINTEDEVYRISTIHFSDTLFEINKNKFNFLKVYKHKNNNSEQIRYTYSASINLKTSHVETENHETVSEALSELNFILRKYKYCNVCTEGYNSVYSNYCPRCLIVDFFCFTNDKICCPICLDETNVFITLNCGHRMHQQCVQKLNKRNCPVCRQSFTI